MILPPVFPDGIWDGLSENIDHKTRLNDHGPDHRDWDRIVAEVISMQEHALTSRIVLSNLTSETDSFAPISDLTFNLGVGKYLFDANLFISTDEVTDSAKFDLAGGTVVDITTNGSGYFVGGTAIKIEALNTEVFSVDFGNYATVKMTGYINVDVAGTLIPRLAQNVHSTGTLLLYEGSNMVVRRVK